MLHRKEICRIIILLFLLFSWNDCFPEGKTLSEKYFEQGYVHYIHGVYDSALICFQLYISSEINTPEPDYIKIAMMHRYKGSCFEKLEMTGHAIYENQQALRIYSEQNDSVMIALSFQKLGSLFKAENKPDQTMIFLKEANRYFEKMKWSARLQHSFFLLGETEFLRMNYNEAFRYLQKSLLVGETNGLASEKTYLEGETWFFIAQILFLEGSEKQGNEALLKAEKLFLLYLNDLPEFSVRLVELYLFRAEYQNKKFPSDAMNEILKAESVISSYPAFFHNRSVILLAKANFYSRNREFDMADNLFREILGRSSISGNNSFSAFESEVIRSLIVHYMNRYQMSKEQSLLETALFYADSLLYKQRLFRQVYSLLPDRAFSGKNGRYLSDYSVDLSVRLFELTGENKYFEKALWYAEQFSQDVFREKSDLAYFDDQMKRDQKMVFEVVQTRREINRLIARIQSDNKGQHDLEKQLVNMLNQFESLRFPGNPSGNFSSFPSPEELHSQLLKKLSGDEVYLKFYETTDVIYQFLISEQGHAVRRIPKTEDYLLIHRKFSGFLQNVSPGGGVPEIAEFASASYALYQIFLEPLINLIQNDDLIIDWSGEGRVVFEPLLTRQVEATGLLLKNFPWCIMERVVRYSGSVILFVRSGDNRLDNWNEFYTGFAPFAAKGSLSDPKLPSSGLEVKQISGILSGRYYRGEKSTKQRILEMAGKTEILHLATHAKIHPVYPQLTELSIYGNEGDFEKLYYYEVVGGNWKSRLIILGACGTAEGTYIPDYGTASLANGFQSAGAESVIGANWQASDLASREILSEMARLIKSGMETSASLHQAKIDFLKNANDLFSHPYFWAVYTYHGPKQNLEINTNTEKEWITKFWILFFIVPVLFFFYRKGRDRGN